MILRITKVENGYKVKWAKGWDATPDGIENYVAVNDQHLLQVVKNLCGREHTGLKFPLPERDRGTLHEAIINTIKLQRYSHPAMADDHYLLDAAGVLPIVEMLADLAQTVDGLLNCAAEFAKDITCCSEYFQAADDKMDQLKKGVGL